MGNNIQGPDYGLFGKGPGKKDPLIVPRPARAAAGRPAARNGPGGQPDARPRADFAFFTLLLGWVTFHLTTPEHSLLGRYAGGICIYLVSVYDAWRIARLREDRFREAGPSDGR
jgi:hypothetical protein